MDTSTPVFYAAELPALISTGITFVYLLLKVGCYLFHAISHQTEGRVAKTLPGCGQHQHNPDPGEEGDTEICKQVSGHFAQQHGGGTQPPQGPFLYQEGGKMYASLPAEMLQNIQRSPLFEKMEKDCKAEGISIPKTIMAKDPVTHVLTPKEYLQKVAEGKMPPMNNHQQMKELAESATENDNTKFMMMDIRDVEPLVQPATQNPQKCK